MWKYYWRIFFPQNREIISRKKNYCKTSSSFVLHIENGLLFFILEMHTQKCEYSRFRFLRISFQRKYVQKIALFNAIFLHHNKLNISKLQRKRSLCKLNILETVANMENIFNITFEQKSLASIIIILLCIVIMTYFRRIDVKFSYI